MLSDRYGRRPVILLSNLGPGLDYIVMALSPTIGWLLLGRVISGITASSIPTAMAYIADRRSEREACGSVRHDRRGIRSRFYSWTRHWRSAGAISMFGCRSWFAAGFSLGQLALRLPLCAGITAAGTSKRIHLPPGEPGRVSSRCCVVIRNCPNWRRCNFSLTSRTKFSLFGRSTPSIATRGAKP